MTLFLSLGISSTSKAECYTTGEVEKLAKAIVDLQNCSMALIEKDELIQVKLAKYDATIAWWQEPSVVVGGLVVSASIATIATVFLLK